MEYHKIDNNSNRISQNGDDNFALQKSPTDERSHNHDIGVFVDDEDDDINNDTELTPAADDDVVLFWPFVEYLKFVLSCFYCMVIMIGQAFTMVYVTNRVYPIRNETQLPDIILDNIGTYSWALKACEYCMLSLFLIWLAIVVFHENRLVLLRRQYYIQGSMYFMRICTTIVTGLPLIDAHKKYAHIPESTFKEYIDRVFEIMSSGSLRIVSQDASILSYGDYIFSGHIMLSTLLTSLICRYSPKSWWWLHSFVFCLNLTASIFMVLDHGHYTIDVILSWFLTSLYFCLYHFLVKFRTDDEYKASVIYSVFFPFYQLFESTKEHYRNEYESPKLFLKRAKKLKLILKEKCDCCS